MAFLLICIFFATFVLTYTIFRTRIRHADYPRHPKNAENLSHSYLPCCSDRNCDPRPCKLRLGREPNNAAPTRSSPAALKMNNGPKSKNFSRKPTNYCTKSPRVSTSPYRQNLAATTSSSLQKNYHLSSSNSQSYSNR